MTRDEFLRLLDPIFEVDAGTLTGEENLQDWEIWDSTAVLEFIALADQQFKLAISAQALRECKTVNDLVQLVESKIVDQNPS
jgi:acyl carrier protein